MTCYLISYDLRNHRDYESLYSAIKLYRNHVKILESLWAVCTNDSAEEIRNKLKQKIDNDDGLFVLKSGREAAWSNVLCSNQWLKDNL